VAGKHPGFAGAEKQIEAKEGLDKNAAGAILASAARKASPAAKKVNPRLARVKPAKNQPKSQAHGIMRQMLDGEKC